MNEQKIDTKTEKNMFKNLEEKEQREIEEQIFQGKNINAIKLYRLYTGLGLKEAKEAIEQVEHELRHERPWKFVPQKKSQGYKVVALMVFLGILSGVYYLMI